MNISASFYRRPNNLATCLVFEPLHLLLRLRWIFYLNVERHLSNSTAYKGMGIRAQEALVIYTATLMLHFTVPASTRFGVDFLRTN